MLGGAWSDALLSQPDVRPSFTGECATCGRILSVPQLVTVCSDPLCLETATHLVLVIGGPRFALCDKHAKKMAEAAFEAGVKAQIELRPVGTPEGSR